MVEWGDVVRIVAIIGYEVALFAVALKLDLIRVDLRFMHQEVIAI